MKRVHQQQKTYENTQSGFALLLTLIVVSVVVALGLSLVEISLRQLNLGGVSRDSEIAFHAAYMGNECAEYSVRMQTNLSEYFTVSRSTGLYDPDSASGYQPCIDGASRTHAYSRPQSNIHLNSYDITWPSGEQCTKIDIYVMDAVSGGDLTFNFGGALGYKNKSCADGRICTLIFSAGYNRSCADVDSGAQRIIQREVVSEF